MDCVAPESVSMAVPELYGGVFYLSSGAGQVFD